MRKSDRFHIWMSGDGFKPVDRQPRGKARIEIKPGPYPDQESFVLELQRRSDGGVAIEVYREYPPDGFRKHIRSFLLTGTPAQSESKPVLPLPEDELGDKPWGLVYCEAGGRDQLLPGRYTEEDVAERVALGMVRQWIAEREKRDDFDWHRSPNRVLSVSNTRTGNTYFTLRPVRARAYLWGGGEFKMNLAPFISIQEEEWDDQYLTRNADDELVYE